MKRVAIPSDGASISAQQYTLCDDADWMDLLSQEMVR